MLPKQWPYYVGGSTKSATKAENYVQEKGLSTSLFMNWDVRPRLVSWGNRSKITEGLVLRPYSYSTEIFSLF
jgi:hypothetical protein